MSWWIVPIYTMVCMALGAAMWEFLPRKFPRHSHPTDGEKKRALRAVREIYARDVRRMK